MSIIDPVLRWIMPGNVFRRLLPWVASIASLPVLAVACAAPSAPGAGALREPAAIVHRTGAANWPILGVDPASCHHAPGSGAHKPSGGFDAADDTYALDLNCLRGSEGGKWVTPVRAGVVRQAHAGQGWVLVEHPEPIVVEGGWYGEYYTGYMHMTDLGVTVGQDVTAATLLGRVGSVPAGTPTHLHFVAYVGSWPASPGVVNRRLVSFNPALLGGELSSYDYDPYVWRAWIDEFGVDAGVPVTSSYYRFASSSEPRVMLWRKTDHCLGRCGDAPTGERAYCLQQRYDTSEPATRCVVHQTLPPGW